MSNSIQPTGYGFAFVDCARAPSQQQESGLESVLCVVPVVQHRVANAPNQRAMTSEQSRKSPFLAVGGEALHQLGVAQFPAGIHQPAEVPNNWVEGCLGHGFDLPRNTALCCIRAGEATNP